MPPALILDAEEKCGHRFSKPALLLDALCHGSTGRPRSASLASLGDRIHNAWAARLVWARTPFAEKGTLHDAMRRLSDGLAQHDALRSLGLDACVVVGAGQLGHAGGGAMVAPPEEVNQKMAATCHEALVAAIELDGGREAAEAYLTRAMAAVIAEHARVDSMPFKDFPAELTANLKG